MFWIQNITQCLINYFEHIGLSYNPVKNFPDAAPPAPLKYY